MKRALVLFLGVVLASSLLSAISCSSENAPLYCEANPTCSPVDTGADRGAADASDASDAPDAPDAPAD